MSRDHSLRFDVLESRKLLATAHVVAAHARPAKVAVPLVLNGTLAVDSKAASTAENSDGTWTTSIPVAGQLGGLGEVRGVWNETVDSFGDVSGLDALRLRDPEGTLIVAFDNQTPGRPRPAAHHTVSVEAAQHVYAGTGAYARASETGSIEILSNAARTVVENLTLHSRGT